MSETVRRFRKEYEDAQAQLTQAHGAMRDKRRERERLVSSPEHAGDVAQLDGELAALRETVRALEARRGASRRRYQRREAWEAKTRAAPQT